MCELSPVTFHGDTIFCIDYHGQPFTPMKPIVENMGLDWRTQARKLRVNRERWGVVIMTTPSESGEQETTCMPVRKLPAFLASINPKKIKPELRQRIELYQNESDNVLWDYWTKGRAERTTPTDQPQQLTPTDSPITPDQQCTLQALVKAKIEAIPEADRPKGLYPQIWSRFKNHFRIAKYNQLPQTRMSEAVEYLTKMNLTEKALPPVSKGLPALPSNDRRAKVFASIHEIICALEEVHTECVYVNSPDKYAPRDHAGACRYAIQAELYKQCMACLRAAQSSLMASSLVGNWA